jgi:hypothetical protein
VDHQEFLLQQDVLSSNGPRAPRSQDFGDRGQQMPEEDEQIFHGGKAVGRQPSGASLPDRMPSGAKSEFATHIY